MAFSPTPPQAPTSPGAMEIVCAKGLHRCFWLPETAAHGKLRVTYSTTTNFSDESLPTILFLGGMFGNRYVTLIFDELAKRARVRGISVDRPAMGGSTPVPLNIRIQVWLETVPALLAHLNVKHISLFSHSAGTIFALNTLYKQRQLLDPHAPYVALLTPWVHSDHSGMSYLGAVSKLPNGMFDSWNGLTKVIATQVAPSFAWSGGIISSAAGLLRGGESEDDDELAEKYGTTKAVAKEVEKLQTSFFFAEDSAGANDDVRLCLKKDEGADWGTCGNYEEYATELGKLERERNTALDNEAAKLRLRVYHAESDALIGKGGREYFERCWQKDAILDAIDYKSAVLPGTRHDTVLTDLRKGALESIFRELAEFSNRATAS